MADLEAVHVVTEFEQNAVLMADSLAEQLIDRHLMVDLVEVSINKTGWVDGEKYPIPHVTIQGIPAETYASARFRQICDDPELIEAAAKSFVEFMSELWFPAIEFHHDLRKLDPLMSDLAQPDGPYFSAAQAEYGDQKYPEDISRTARDMACTAFRKWCEAVQDQEEADKPKRELPFSMKVDIVGQALHSSGIKYGTTYEDLLSWGWEIHPDEVPVVQAALEDLKNYFPVVPHLPADMHGLEQPSRTSQTNVTEPGKDWQPERPLTDF